MHCSDYVNSLLCLSRTTDHWRWFGIFVIVVLLITCFIYGYSKPNYSQFSSNAYELISPIEQTIAPSSDNALRCPSVTNHCSTKNNKKRFENENRCQWREFRTPTIANYPDLIDSSKIERMHRSSSTRLPADIQQLVEKGFIDSEERSATGAATYLGRLWFFLEYNPYLRELYLTIVKARNLKSDKSVKPNTFVRAQLLPALNVSFSTELIRNTSNPDYMSETIFHLNLSEFPENVLKMTVHEVDDNGFQNSIGTVYYPLDHFLLAQRAKGQVIWRNLIPGRAEQRFINRFSSQRFRSDYGDPSAIGLIQIRATVWYDSNDEYLNIQIHSLRTTGSVDEVTRVYVHASVSIDDRPVLPQEHLESELIATATNDQMQQGPLVMLNGQSDTNYDQLFRFLIYKDEFPKLTVLIDVFRRSFGDHFLNDTRLGRTVLVSRDILAQNTKPNETSQEKILTLI